MVLLRKTLICLCSHCICVKEKEYVKLFVCPTQAPELEGGNPIPELNCSCTLEVLSRRDVKFIII